MNSKIKKGTLKLNFFLQIIYQIIILVIPLFQAPLLTRNLGDTALGTFTYVNSIAYYFLVIAKLGIDRYGQRVIATCKQDELRLRKSFWSLFYTHAFFSLISILVYFILSIFVFTENNNLFIINGIYVFSVLLDITWLFYGLENFKSVVLKNLVIKILEFVLIILLVKQPSDLWIYATIVCVGFLLGNLCLWPGTIMKIKPIKVDFKECIFHIKPLLILSISAIASTLYTVFDKTLLGLISSKEAVAYYEFADKIINIPKAITAVIGTVLFPRACLMASKGDIIAQKKYTELSFVFVSFISCASIFGLLSLGPNFAIVYFGESFSTTGQVMQIMGFLVYIVGIGDVLRNIYIIPMEKDIPYVICVCINAILNVVISLILIPFIGIYGAVVGTICAETFGLLFQLFLCRKEKTLLPLLKATILFSISGGIMYLVLSIMVQKLNISILSLVIEFAVGAFIDILLSVALILVFYPNYRKRIINKLFISKSKTKEVNQNEINKEN